MSTVTHNLSALENGDAETSVRPNVVYVGLMRAGSQFLRSYFAVHPQIQWTRKAWHFQLDLDDQQRRRNYLGYFRSIDPRDCLIDVYEALSLSQYFKARIEREDLNRDSPLWSPDWAISQKVGMRSAPVAVDPAEITRRIHDCLPEAKILMVLRNQVDWLRSMYLHYLEHLPFGYRSFQHFLDTVEGRCALDAGFYDRFLTGCFGLFGRDRVHVMLLERLAAFEQVELQALCRFLGVEYVAHDHSRADRNAGRGNAAALRFGRLVGRLLSHTPWTCDNLSPRHEAVIRAFYSASNTRTAELLACDLSEFRYPM